MAVVDGPFNFMGYTDNGESPPTDSDQPCSSSSYKPTPTSVSTETVTLINNSTEGPEQAVGYQNRAHSLYFQKGRRRSYLVVSKEMTDSSC